MIDEDLKKLEERVSKLRSIFEGVYDKFSEIGEEIDSSYSDLQEDMAKTGDVCLPPKKLTAKQKKQLALKLLKEKYPGIVKTFDEVGMFIIGIDDLVQQKVDDLQETLDKLDEIDDMKDEIERRKAELD
jgi:uncharacterized membrane-anchored protein YhcB (DUF1043 family)